MATVQIHTAARPRQLVHWRAIILGIAALAIFMSGPGQSYSVAAFIDPMLSGLQLLRTEFSAAYLVATLIGGLTLPMIGRLLDVHGARRVLPATSLLLGLACTWLAQVERLPGLYVGLTLIRCLGQGCLALTATWLVGQWFLRRRGLAMGLAGLGGTLSVMSFPQVNDALITHFGWRAAWLVLALSVWLVLVCPALLLVRNRPEDLGLNVADKGEAAATPDAPLPSSVADDQWTAAQACRTGSFWKMLAVLATSSMIGTGLLFHQVSIMAECGVSRPHALGLIGVQAVIATLVSVVAGYLTDRTEGRYLLAAGMVALSAALLLLQLVQSLTAAVAYAVLLGCNGGVMRSTGTVVWINYYGRLHQGAVRGLAMSFAVAAAALGPLPLALAKDYTGSYRVALAVFLALPAIAGVLVWSAHRPSRNGVEDCNINQS